MRYFLCFCIIISTFSALGQKGPTTTYAQFWDEIQFTAALKGKWALEFNFGNTWTSKANESSLFYTKSQLYVREWVHYYASPRWKLSMFIAYFYNKDVPEITQTKNSEIRWALQAIYFFHKIGYTLTTRVRVEDRSIQNNDGYLETVFRFRWQGKLVVPFNSKRIRARTIYGLASDEVFFKTAGNVSGSTSFDRNRFIIGGGYSITDDVSVEVAYANEYLPRPSGNEVINAAQLTIGFNNLFEHIKNKLKKKEREVNGTD
jgi:hypothetical protein